MWLAFGIVLAILELVTPGGFYFLFFGVSAIAVGLLSGLGVTAEAWVEVMLFSILSVVSLLLFRKPLLQKFHPLISDNQVDSLVGETAMALEDIAASGFGKVELRGAAWNACNNGDRPLSPGQRCTVERIEGLSLWVRAQ